MKFKSNKLKGIYTALITPFHNDKIDEQSFEKIINFQIDNKINGVIPCGTTGESATLSFDERKYLTRLCIDIVDRKIPVMANVASNSTKEVIELAQDAQNAGADYIIVVTPYYNRPNSEGLYQHYKKISESIDLPIIIYNVPSRTACDINDETIIRLADIKNIVGIKDATGNLSRPLNLSYNIKKEFYQFSGDDVTSLAFNIQGGVGCISVASNIAPALCVELQNLWINGQIRKAQELNKKLLPLFKILFCEVNPTPIKYGAKLLNLCNGELRLPLTEISDLNKDLINEIMLELMIL